jgi:hypothetical protein
MIKARGYAPRAAALVAGIVIAATTYAAMPKIPHLTASIETIPHSSQRYDTAGDWSLQDGNIVVKVSQLSRRDYELLVALHELVEAYLCQRDGISQKAVDAWDTGPGKDEDEPGDDPKSLYFHQHRVASKIERFVAKQIGVSWAAYNRELESQ